MALPRPCLMLVTEPGPRLPEIVAAAVAGGVDAVQWRNKITPAHTLRDLAPMMQAATEGAWWLVNGPPYPAEAHGLHLPSSALGDRASLETASEWAGNVLLLGYSIHTVAEAKQAQSAQADYAVAGTIFASQSHPDIAPGGVDHLRCVCRSVSLEILAIGGVTPERVGECIGAGAMGVAVLSPIMRAANPQAVAREYRAALDAAWDTEREHHPCS